ncbi:LysR family transcriptional regulator [Ramlibacter henchirensis]|jgi:DNA-binding transcriptional LysR family regulator|uniref:LysR family transcriptional regulator n=1 Tax=Ramlibacter henchirensis TaxID=204072 RepID=A0A4Z0C3M7_9BURK|nr:LysR family transcriptional regulator [Ramlibacter henchirensis]TFZ06133.1 LysR family transcriptional regulator [Ramlibacter henchirensis]
MALRLDDIDYFLAVAQHGQLRRAADALGLSQPALTKALQRLEKELGFPLFVRSARGMALTPVAQQFRERTQALRNSLAEAIKEAADLHLGAMGVLRVGVSPLYAERLFVPAALQLHQQRPAARMRVMVNLNDALLAALRLGDLDLTLSALPRVPPDDLEATPLMRDDLCMVVREHHPLLERRRLRLQDLEQAQWMLPGASVAGRRSVEGRLAQAGLPPPRVAVEVSNTAGSLTRLLAHSDLVSIMSETTLASPMGSGLVALPMADARFTRAIGALTRRDAALPPLAQRFLQLLRDNVISGA